jgi:Icc-related predicted phosphoesterase
MRLFLTSDIHTDIWFEYAIADRKRLEPDDPDESVVFETLEHIWNLYRYPTDVDGICVAGDITNDFQSTCSTLAWLSQKYKKVFFCVGNHDLVVRGGTPSKSNLQFMSSFEKVTNLERFADSLGNVHLLDSSMVHPGIAGTMGFCDFKSTCSGDFAERMKIHWRRNWFDGKHWRLDDMNPDFRWNASREAMLNTVRMQPKIMMTHYTPIQAGITFDYRNDPANAFFYFDGTEFFEELDHDTIWLCGHVHDARKAEYVNAKGFKVTILCNPSGYPSDEHKWLYRVDDRGRAISDKPLDQSDFVVDINI